MLPPARALPYTSVELFVTLTFPLAWTSPVIFWFEPVLMLPRLDTLPM